MCDDCEAEVFSMEVILKKGAGRSLKSGGAFIYDNEIDCVKGDFENGDIAKVLDFDGFFLGYGFINVNSVIRIRMLSRYRKEPPDEVFFRERIKAAWALRKDVIDTSCCRIIFGEADFLPGLTVDRYENILVFECLALGMKKLLPIVIPALVDVLSEDGIDIRGVYERSDAPVIKKEGLEPKKGWYYKKDPDDDIPTEVIITENGIRYRVDFENGQKTGFFLDQKNNRRRLNDLVKGMKRDSASKVSVLDCFTHMGTFALNAAMGGADAVTALDISKTAIEAARENASMNGLSERVSFVECDVFEMLPKLYTEGKTYDIVVLDPPAFTKSREATKRAVAGYREINMRGLSLVRENGYLLTCSCSHFMTNELFAKMIREAARGAKKRVRQLTFSQQAPDHPVLINSEENSYYLKFFIFQVMTEL